MSSQAPNKVPLLLTQRLSFITEWYAKKCYWRYDVRKKRIKEHLSIFFSATDHENTKMSFFKFLSMSTPSCFERFMSGKIFPGRSKSPTDGFADCGFRQNFDEMGFSCNTQCRWGLHSTEVAFALLAQNPQVRISTLPKFFWWYSERSALRSPLDKSLQQNITRQCRKTGLLIAEENNAKL